jgi:hypothetical protein
MPIVKFGLTPIGVHTYPKKSLPYHVRDILLSEPYFTKFVEAPNRYTVPLIHVSQVFKPAICGIREQ